MTFIDTLRSTNQKLEDWLDGARATTDGERRERQQVLDMQRQIQQQIDDLALKELSFAAKDVSSFTTQVVVLNEQIDATTRSIQTAQRVIAAVSEVVAVAAQVTALIAGV